MKLPMLCLACGATAAPADVCDGCVSDLELRLRNALAEVRLLTGIAEDEARDAADESAAAHAAGEEAEDTAALLRLAEAECATLREAVDLAWGIIANVNGGEWAALDKNWCSAALVWRERFVDSVAGSKMGAPESPELDTLIQAFIKALPPGA